MADTDNISAWIKDDAINTYGPGSCNYKMDKGINDQGNQKSNNNWEGNQTLSLGYGMDYAICGAANNADHDGCILLSKADFVNTVMDIY